MRKGLLAVLVLLTAIGVGAQTRITVTGVVTDTGGVPATSGYVQFQLSPNSNAVAFRVIGTSIFAPTVSKCGINIVGQVKSFADLTQPCLLWGNDVITPGNTAYSVTYAPANQVTKTVSNVLFAGAGPVDLSNPTFAPNVQINPQYQTIFSSPFQTNIIPSADAVFNVGQLGRAYAAGYFYNLFTQGLSATGNVTLNNVTITGACVGCSGATSGPGVFNITASPFLAACNGIADDTTPMNSAIAAAIAYGPAAQVLIPPNTNFCNFAGTLNLGTGFFTVQQQGPVRFSHTVVVPQWVQWIGRGLGAPTSGQRLPEALITTTGNISAFHINSQNVSLYNLRIAPDGFQTTAHTIVWDSGAAGLTMNNVMVSANGTGDPFHADGSSAGGMFGLYCTDCGFQATASNTNHAAIYLRDIGLINFTRTYVGAFGWHYVFDVASGGASNFAIDGVSFSEALGDDVVILESNGANGINGVFISHVTAADNIVVNYAVRAIGTNDNIADVYLDGVLAVTDCVNPASTKHIGGLWARNSPCTTIPVGSFGSVQTNGGFQIYGTGNIDAGQPAGIALNIARGPLVAGAPFAQNTDTVHRFCDVLTGCNAYSQSSFTTPLIVFDSKATAAGVLYWSPANGTTTLDHYDGGTNREQIQMGNGQLQFKVGAKNFTIYETANGNNLAGDAQSGGRLCITNSGNQVCFAGSPTAFRTQTLQDASGTVPLIIQSGTSTLANATVNAGACAAVVTTAAANTLTTDTVSWSFASAPTTADGSLNYSWYVTAGNVNWKVCNTSAGNLTPSGLVINWRVIR